MRKSILFFTILLNCLILIGCSSLDKNTCNTEDYKLTGDIFYKDRCFRDKGVKTGNVEFCKKIVTEDEKSNCIQNVAGLTKNVELCKELPINSKDWCYDIYATQNENPSICESISESEVKNHCYTTVASVTSNHTLCGKMVESREKDFCFWRIAIRIKLYTENPSNCERVGGGTLMEGCYRIVEENLDYKEVCGNIKDSEIKEDCISGIRI